MMKNVSQQTGEILRQHRAAPASVGLESQCHHCNKSCCSHGALLINAVGMESILHLPSFCIITIHGRQITTETLREPGLRTWLPLHRHPLKTTHVGWPT